jgi:hypothetical protein
MIRKSLSLFALLAAALAFTFAPAASHAQQSQAVASNATVGTSGWFINNKTLALHDIETNAFNTGGTVDPSCYLYWEDANGNNYTGSVIAFNVNAQSIVKGVKILTTTVTAYGSYALADGTPEFNGYAVETITQALDITGKVTLTTIEVVTYRDDLDLPAIDPTDVAFDTGALVTFGINGSLLITG